ncbi:MAG TPA: glycosyltransferase [Acetobacteraceae bacterium]|nr:glycosyltransferase [Acetobacteraceae bacterium]
MPGTLSAVVVSYNRAALIGTCLRALGFADEVIVVDKSSTDATPEIAARHADRVVTVPWTPAVEDTRAFAVDQCAADWILCLDDDECLGPGAGLGIRSELAMPRADIYYLPLRHYVLGVHDEAAYYWPEHHPRLFRRGALMFTGTVHGGIRLRSDRTLHLPPESGVVIHHLSHRDAAEWIDKCNRYTSRPDRQRVEHAGQDLAAFAHARIGHWLARTKDQAPGGYPVAAAVLRALYDIVDRLKTWEEERDLDGSAEFARICAALDAGYAALPAAPARAGTVTRGCPVQLACGEDPERAALRARIAELRAHYDATAADATNRANDAARWAAEATRLDAELSAAIQRVERTDQALQAERRRIEAIEASTCWRATAGARRLAERAKRLARRR